MSKSMMGSAGGGKVTVDGLDADVVLSGSTVTVKQGTKVVQQVEGSASQIRFFCGGGIRASDTRDSGYAAVWIGSDEQIHVGAAGGGQVSKPKITGTCRVRAGQTLRCSGGGVSLTFDGQACGSGYTRTFDKDADCEFVVTATGGVGPTGYTAYIA